MFGLKKSVDDIVGLVSKLSDEERQELMSRLSDRKPDTEDEKEFAEAESDAADEGKDGKEAQDSEDESVAAQEEDKGEEDSQSAEAREHESESTELADEERAVEEKDKGEPEKRPESSASAPDTTDSSEALDNAQTARIEALESEIAALKDLIAKYMGEDENRDFGLDAHAPEAKDRHEEHASAVMRAYAGSKAGEYM